MNSTDLTLRTYREHADDYIAATAGVVSEPIRSLLDDLVASAPGQQVLEVGTGPGREALYLEQHGMRVLRTDATPAFVDRLRQAGHDAHVVDVRTDNLGGPHDAIVAHAVLLHLDRSEFDRVLRACHAATRPGGVFALTLKEGDGEAWSEAKLDAPRWYVYWRESSLVAALQRADWQIVRIDLVHGQDEPWLLALCRRPQLDDGESS